MARREITALLSEPRTPELGAELIAWAEETQDRIDRGDMILGILTPDEVGKIPLAYHAAVECGEVKAWIALTRWHAAPAYGEADFELAAQAIRKAVDAQVEGARLEFARFQWFFCRESATNEEQKLAYRYCQLVSKKDPQDGDACCLLGILTTHGFGVERSPVAGTEMLRRAAELNHAGAMFELFIHSAYGIGMPEDWHTAMDWCRKAATAGNARAMYNLGAFHATGQHVAKDMVAAVDWYERSAELGNANALVGLAAIYSSGDGVERDAEAAREYLNRAEYLGIDVDQLRTDWELSDS